MRFQRAHSVVATLVTLAFSAVLLAPCFCATATASELDESDDGDCCPTQNEEPDEPGEHDNDEGDDCCCAVFSVCEQSSQAVPVGGGDALISTFQEDGEIDSPTTWWTPDLVAALWLVDYLAGVDDTVDVSDDIPPLENRPDRSETYLQQLTLLL